MRTTIAILGSLLLAGSAEAAVPRQLSAQGLLRNNLGQLQSAMVPITVRLYDSQSMGTQLGSTHGPTTVMAQNGLFALTITLSASDVTSLAGATQVWLELTAGVDVFPRQLVTPQVYALFAGTADALSPACSGCVSDMMLGSTISGSKISGAVASATNAATVTNGVYTNGTYADPVFITSIAGSKISGTVASATSAVSFSGSLAGDVTGTQAATQVVKIGGATVAAAPTTAGQYLRATGANVWNVSSILAGDLPSLSDSYVDMASNQTAIGGTKAFTGNVGIGTSSPNAGAKLHVVGGDILQEMAAGNQVIHVYRQDVNRFSTYVEASGATWNVARHDDSGAAVSQPPITVRRDNGDVGFGTTSPNATLHVTAGGNVVGAGGAVAFGANNGLLPMAQIKGALGGASGGEEGGDLVFYTRASGGGGQPLTERMRIYEGGVVHIGTPSATNRLLSVNGGASKVSGGTWDTYSDERLKNVKGTFTRGLGEVMALSPIRYRYKRDNALGLVDEGEHVGLSAQQVERVLPEAVSKTKTGYRMLNSDPVIWAMLNAIKQQQSQLDAQRREIQALKSALRRR